MVKGQKKRVVIAICAVLALALLSFGATSLFASADPSNGGFEGVVDGLPMGWVNVSGKASMDYNESMSGTASLKLEGASSAVRQRYIPAVGGETYTIKAQVKVSNAGARPYIEATSYNGANCLGATANTGAYQSFVAGTWNELTLQYTAAPTATYIEVLVSSGNADATVWVDSVTVSGAVSVADSTGNRIKNGSFDADASQWATSGTVSYDSSVGYVGNGSMKITASSANPNTNGIGFSQDGIFVTPGKTYEIKMYYMSDVANVRPEIQGYTYLGGGEIGTAIANMTAETSGVANTWNEYVTEYTVPANVPAMKLIFTALAPKGANIWIDAVSVRDIDDVNTNVQGENLIVNGSFETANLNGWTTFKYGTYSYDYNIKYDGTASLKMTTESANPIVNIKQYVPVTAGHTYELSAYFCVDNAEARPFFNLAWYNGDSMIGDAMFQIHAESGPSSWTKLSSTVKAPEGATKLYVEFNLRKLVGANIWVDGITMVDTAATESKVNVILNPGFESGSANWNFYAQNENVVSAVDTTVSHSGSNSAKFQFNDSGRAYTQQKNILLEPNTKYIFSAWCRTENLPKKPEIIMRWVKESGESQTFLYGTEGTSDWHQITYETVTPSDIKSVVIYPNLSTTGGTVWFDDLELYAVVEDVAPMLGSTHAFTDGSLEKGAAADSPWSLNAVGQGGNIVFDTANKYAGKQSVRLTATSAENDLKVIQENVAVDAGMTTCHFTVNYKTSNLNANAYAKLMWYDTNGKYISTSALSIKSTTDWTFGDIKATVPEGAKKCAVVLGINDGTGTVWFDNITIGALSTILNVYYEPVYVSNVVNINESFFEPQDSNPNNDDPQKFWDMIPAEPLSEPTTTLWAEPFFRSSYFGTVDGIAYGSRFTIPSEVRSRDASTPVRSGYLGKSTVGGPALVIASDIDYRPFILGHSGYSDRYYPRTEAHYIRNEYLPAYILTGDESFLERAKELLNFMEFSQWKADGTNEFVKKYYTGHSDPEQAYAIHPEYRGGWDHAYDWQWTDGYKYTWDYHEPDHHVNSLQASEILDIYSVIGGEKYVEMCREFVYYQIPRYGFHSGDWNGHTYYWTEYNPTGDSVGNTTWDACDNVSALVAEASAMVGYYEKDPVMKARFLEYARGLMWYLVREFESDGKWFYDGGENPMSQRKAISHDNTCMYESWRTLAYLYKAGSDVSEFLPYFEEFNRNYNTQNGLYQKKRYAEIGKIYDGTPATGRNIKFTSFINVTSQDLENARFADTIPSYGFVVPSLLNVRISHILPPNGTTDDWTVDPAQDVVFTVTPEQLASGINIPFTLEYMEQYRVTYTLKTISGTFNRGLVKDTASSITAWSVDENNSATYIKADSEVAALGGSGFTMPISQDFLVDSSNFLSFPADLHFRFEREMASKFVDTDAPTATSYKDQDNWANLNADEYIYPINVMFSDLISTDRGASLDTILDRGRMFKFATVGSSASFNLPVPTSEGTFDVYTSYMKADRRGIAQVYLDGVKQGGTFDQYANTIYTVPQVVENISLGRANLSKGNHILKYEVVGKNDASTGYEIAVYDALILRPVK